MIDTKYVLPVFWNQKKSNEPDLNIVGFLTVSLLLSVVAYRGLSDKLDSKNSGGSGPAAKKSR